LSELSDISESAIYRIESGCNPYKVNEGVAKALAEALYLEVSDLFTQTELSHLGRPPHTGTSLTVVPNVGVHEMLCVSCNLVVPRATGCENCVAA
jgi:DNA-binding XRE family transcriptional regulator